MHSDGTELSDQMHGSDNNGWSGRARNDAEAEEIWNTFCSLKCLGVWLVQESTEEMTVIDTSQYPFKG